MQPTCTGNQLLLTLQMKTFTFILSIYIAALAVVPCSDGMDLNTHKLTTDVSIEHHDHNDDDHEEDGCSTFCSCACCGTSLIIPANQLVAQSESALVTKHVFYYSAEYSYDFNLGIWHPPSLS